jgi:hypothetical protein
MSDNKVCMSDCDVTKYILKYLIAIFQYLSVSLDDYNMKLKTTKCLNTAVMLVYILGSENDIKTKVNYCDTDNINNRYNKIKTYEKKIEKKKQILDKLEKNILDNKFNKRQFYYILLTHTTMKNTTNKKNGWFPGHVYIIEKSKNCKGKLNYKIFQSYINQYDLNGHYKNNNNTMEIKDNNIKSIISGMRNILLRKTWNKRAVKFWKKLCYVDTNDLLHCKTDNINICFQKITIKNCYLNLINFTDNALNEIKVNINKNNLEYYKINNIDENIKQYDIYNLYKEFENLKNDILV